ncbi:MAG: Stp1/IreP family PP2C-type Ser/Thr phosphatase [Bacillota bacterium]|nr:Stp1/IreP family PP2C-type Ser/Thr phosphatase [Bacillota bacterium]
MNVWGMSDRGIVRQENQDMFLVDAMHERNQAVIAVCDGMGGARAGNVASEIAINTFSEEIKDSLKPSMTAGYMKNIAIAAVHAANARVFEKSNESDKLKGMGTTLVGAIFDEGKTVIVNVGDSRAYLADGAGSIVRITKDHSVVEEMVQRGEITEEEARNHPHKNLITRALGADSSTKPDAYSLTLKTGQSLLLCSDGLTNMLSDSEILAELVNNPKPEKCCEKLISCANGRGGIDNITVILLKL